MALKDHAKKVRDLLQIDPRKIVVQPGFNVRKPGPALDAHLEDLTASISENGVQNALTVRLQSNQVFLVDGHCRLAATMRAIENGVPIETVPCVPEGSYASEADRTLTLITRNSGKPLEALEKAEVFQRLLGFGWDEEQIAKKAGVTVRQVQNILTLLTAPTEVKEMIVAGKVAATTVIGALRGSEDTEEAAQAIVEAVEAAEASGRKRATARDLNPQQRRLSSQAVADLAGTLQEILNVEDTQTIHTMVRDALITHRLN
jgi:ParB/RepB/Spo0J family partition protein